VAFGLDAWRAYFEVTGPLQVRVLASLSDFGTYMVTSVMVSMARTFGVSLQAGFVVQVMVAIPVIALAVWAIRQTADPAKRVFVLVTATLLATPYAMVYDFAALTAVMLWRVCGPQPLGLVRAGIMLAAWLMPVGAMYLNNWGLGLAPLALMGVFAIAVGDVLAGTARLPWRFRRTASLSGASVAPAR
jgi:hypothetical protein